MKTLFRILCVIVGWRCPAPPVPEHVPPCGAGGACDYMELIVGNRGHIFIFRIRDKASRDLLLPAVMRVAANEELPFDDDDAAAVMYDAVDVWGRADEIECRGK